MSSPNLYDRSDGSLTATPIGSSMYETLQNYNTLVGIQIHYTVGEATFIQNHRAHHNLPNVSNKDGFSIK